LVAWQEAVFALYLRERYKLDRVVEWFILG